MGRHKRVLLILVTFLAVVTASSLFLITQSWLHMYGTLERAKRDGVYTTPEDGMRALIAKNWRGVEKIEIEYAGPNSFDGSNPHVGFVVAKVWAASRADGSAIHPDGYDYPGSYFLRVRDGWVHVSEGSFPEFIGQCMLLFHYSG